MKTMSQVAKVSDAPETLDEARKIIDGQCGSIAVWRDRAVALEELLRSARCICERKGADTAWERFDASIAAYGIGSVTARVYKVLADDNRD